MDNLGSHRGKAVWQAIRKARAKLLFLPKYSPDLNPIEQVFSKLKHLLRKAQGRSYGALLKATGKLLSAFSPEECCNYLKNCGYGFVFKSVALNEISLRRFKISRTIAGRGI